MSTFGDERARQSSEGPGSARAERGAAGSGWPSRRFVLTVVVSTAAVVVVAAVQHRLFVGSDLQLHFFLFPLAVGFTFGVLLALVRAARAREREARERLAAREGEIVRLNAELEARVRARTAELEQRTDALVLAQRREALGLLAGGVAHDFNNVLAAVFGCAAALREELASAGARPPSGGACTTLLDELDASAERGRRIAQQLVTLGRSSAAGAGPVDLAALARDMGPMLRRLAGERIEVRVSTPEERCEVRGERAQLEQLVLNLAVNARDAMPDGGALGVAVERGGERVFLVVTDTGEGMDEETRARLFEPYFTTRARRGSGLGGMVVQEVVRRWAERLDVESAPGRGSRFCVTFPAFVAPGPQPAVDPAAAS